MTKQITIHRSQPDVNFCFFPSEKKNREDMKENNYTHPAYLLAGGMLHFYKQKLWPLLLSQQTNQHSIMPTYWVSSSYTLMMELAQLMGTPRGGGELA